MGLSSIFVLPQNITAISIPMKYIISWTKPHYRKEKTDQKDKMTLIFNIAVENQMTFNHKCTEGICLF